MNGKNYVMTAEAIPKIIFSSKESFIEKIFPNPKNMDYFISTDLWSKINKRPGKLRIKMFARKTTNDYEIVFVNFGEEAALAPTEAKAIAMAVKGDEVKYFTCERVEPVSDSQDVWLIGSWEPDGDDLKHLDFGHEEEMSIEKFAEKVEEILGSM